MSHARFRIGTIALALLGVCVPAYSLPPPEQAPAHHWPWWLRVLAVIGVLIFVQLVARSVRSGSGGQGHGPTNPQ